MSRDHGCPSCSYENALCAQLYRVVTTRTWLGKKLIKRLPDGVLATCANCGVVYRVDERGVTAVRPPVPNAAPPSDTAPARPERKPKPQDLVTDPDLRWEDK